MIYSDLDNECKYEFDEAPTLGSWPTFLTKIDEMDNLAKRVVRVGNN